MIGLHLQLSVVRTGFGGRPHVSRTVKNWCCQMLSGKCAVRQVLSGRSVAGAARQVLSGRCCQAGAVRQVLSGRCCHTQWCQASADAASARHWSNMSRDGAYLTDVGEPLTFAFISSLITMAETTPRPLPLRLIDATGSVPLSCFTGSGQPPSEPSSVTKFRERLSRIPGANALAPSGPSKFSERLICEVQIDTQE